MKAEATGIIRKTESPSIRTAEPQESSMSSPPTSPTQGIETVSGTKLFRRNRKPV